MIEILGNICAAVFFTGLGVVVLVVVACFGAFMWQNPITATLGIGAMVVLLFLGKVN